MVKKAVVLLFILGGFFLLSGHGHLTQQEQSAISLLRLKYKVLQFAQKYKDQDTIVVSKSTHLLFFCREGEIVTNEHWQGFNYNFPVKVALASQYYKTPEGEMYVDGKNPQSRFILFLSLSTPGAYGIHSAPTRYRSYLEKMELRNPNFKFATLKDDTRGCVQVENRIIKYLYANAAVGTPVLVMP